MKIFLKLILISLALLVSNTHARIGLGTRCPTSPLIPDFDLNRYSGKWYDIESIFRRESKCVTAEYAVKENNRISVKNTGININTGEIRTGEGEGFIPNTNEPNKLIVRLNQDSIFSFLSEGNYHIWKTDYDNYALVYSCKIYFGFIRFDAIWLLSRTKSLTEEKTTELKKLLTDNGVNINGFVKAEQNCNN
ncbi:apolipo D [Brachionus plicatilis]|uniref:Apolipoprotein D n=1 Tax=Brachionus plicatilis TaxID=10195 RepID=A0A3M7RSS9_BRAPC|nr:apolipo D [Brachionus plicatilis]